MSNYFSNTETAFKPKSDTALRRAYWLFQLMGSNFLVKAGSELGALALKLHLPIQWTIRQTLFKQFCGGETIEECKAVIADLQKFHVGTILDFSVEAQNNDESFDKTKNEVLKTIELASSNPSLPFCVFKFSGIASFEVMEKLSEDRTVSSADAESWNRSLARLDEICRTAFTAGVRVFVDAEESWIQSTVDEATEQMMAKYNRDSAHIFTTLQMYRRDRLEYLHGLLARASAQGYHLGIKIVRGAYMEKERARAQQTHHHSPVYDSKAETDTAYNTALEFCLKNLNRIEFCAGTHNEASSKLLADRMTAMQIAPSDNRIHFAQLLGMSDHITYNLAALGFNAAKYVPYGPVKEVFPYLTRRAKENTSIQGQTGRELSLIKQELKRRSHSRGKGIQRSTEKNFQQS